MTDPLLTFAALAQDLEDTLDTPGTYQITEDERFAIVGAGIRGDCHEYRT